MKYKFNNKYIKDLAKPGSWRRGYECYHKGLVYDVEVKDTVIKGKIKGNFKDHYDVSLKFNKTGVKPECSCPLDEPWCKHVVALGLYAIKEHLVDELMYENIFEITN